MKLSKKEKLRILELHQNSPMKPWLFEQSDTIPNIFSWGDNATTTTMGTDKGMYSTNITRPSEMEPEAYAKYLELLKQQKKDLHDMLESIAFYTGFIPIPIAQVISIGVDLANVAIYVDEGDYNTAGLYVILAGTSWGAFKLTAPVMDSITRNYFKSTAESIGKKLEKNAFETITSKEATILKEIVDNKNQIYNGFNKFTKQQAEDYLKRPEFYKYAFNFKLRTDLVKFKWGSNTAIAFYKETAKNGIEFLHKGLVQGGFDIMFAIAAESEWRSNFLDKLESMGYDKKNIIEEFFIDENNPDDIKRLEKAWNDPKLKSIAKNGTVVNGWRPSNGNINLGLATPLPCEYYGSLFESDNIDLPCVKILTQDDLASKNIKLPYIYKMSGSNYYAAKIPKNKEDKIKWAKLTDKPNIEFLKNQIFTQFTK